MRGIDGERLRRGIRLGFPGDRHLRSWRVDACQFSRFPGKALGLTRLTLARKNPSRRPVVRVGGDVSGCAQVFRHKVLQVGQLLLVHDRGRIDVGNEGRHLERAQRAFQGVVLGRFGGLIKEHVQRDYSRAFFLQCPQQLGDEPAVHRRAIREAGDGLLGDGGDHDIG